VKATKSKEQPNGLVDFFGHTYCTDPDDAERMMIQYQFKIIRKMDDARYVIQYFSFWDGGPTNLGVMTEAELLGESVKLYATAAAWNDAHEKDCARRKR
jgi:hypothetical protein